MPENIELSIVVPVFNESESLAELYSKLKQVIERLNKEYEIVFIDDGSTDNSFEVLEGIHAQDSRVKAIKFRKNFGQTAAISAGFDYTKGKIIVTMDSDLQNDPEDIPKLLQKLDEGFDVVSGWRTDRKDPITKKIPSLISNFLARHLTGVNIHDFGCTLKVYKRDVLTDMELYGDVHRYIPALIAWKGFKIGEIQVKHHPRKKGKTKYGCKRFIKGILDLILVTFWQKYSARPIHIFGSVGLLLFLLGFVLGGYLGVMRLFFGYPLSDKPLFLLSILILIIGIQFIATGVLADIMLKLYHTQGKRRNYFIERII
ncbi:MAG: glycosyltransferase family 2 protein [Candidatus Altiarchaeota archaeon]|nr:glycosyltransferase family 2 protein [Candidatus Altiarchaeota archaeon]